MMRSKWLAAGMVCLLFLAFGQAHAELIVRAESPEAVDGDIPLAAADSFHIDIWMNNTTAKDLCGGSFSFHLYSPDNSFESITHLQVPGGRTSTLSVEYINGFKSDIFDVATLTDENGWGEQGVWPHSVGNLPDSVSFTFAGMECLKQAYPDRNYIRFNLRLSEQGLICIDSIIHQSDEDWEWLFEDDFEPVTFGGPYCWTVGGYSPNFPPEITCPDDITIECGESVDPSNTGQATATDDSDPDPGITYSDSYSAGTCPAVLIITRTWTATDNQGATSSCVQTITVADNTNPVITCPADVQIECDASTDPSNTGQATATDACDESPTVAYSDEVVGDVITRTWTATDACDNVASCVQTITIVDNTPPTVTCPDDITVDNDAGQCGAVVSFEASATDNCPGDVTITYDPESGSTFAIGETQVTVTATDAADNSNQCTFYVTVNDAELPVITCPDDITVACDESIDPANTGAATATDNCGTPTVTYSDVTAGTCPTVITRTWSADDGNGNIVTCDQIITVEDIIAPVITCPDDVAVPYGESTEPDNTGYATATDNCDAAPVITHSDVTDGNVITRTWTATDNCDNSSTCDQTITIQGSGTPVITCPDDVNIDCTASTDPANTGYATATDDNDPELDITYEDEITPGECPQEMVIARTWTATDDDMNSSSCTQTITVTDETAPVITCPDDVTIDCAASVGPENTGYATATDNCDESPAVTYEDAQTDNVITRTWTATDACGNAATCDQAITIEDNTDPVITCPDDITIDCAASTEPENTGYATATDDCDADVDITYADEETPGDCDYEKTITRTWTATDDYGNTATCVQTITVDDAEGPVITCPDDITVAYGASTDPENTGFATATDNCDPEPAVTYEDGETMDMTFTRTWTATDVCGNASTCDQQITMEEMGDPYLLVDPESFVFNVTEGDMVENQILNVSERYDRNVSFSVTNDSSWLMINTTFPVTTPNAVLFDIDMTTRTMGVYRDTLYVESAESQNSPLKVPVEVNVAPFVPPPDSVWVSTVPGVPGSKIVVPIYFKNNDPLEKINLPMQWSASGIDLDSVSFVGTRVEYVDDLEKGYTFSNTYRQVQITVDPTFSELIPGGRGLLAKLHFTINPFLPATFIAINSTVIPPDGYIYFTDYLGEEITPVYTAGGVVVDDEPTFVCGRVIDNEGNEIEGATVEFWDNFPAGVLMTSQFSDENGQFACGTLGIVPFDAYAYMSGYYPGVVYDIDYGTLGIEIVITKIGEVHESNEWVHFFSGETCLSYFHNVPMPVGTVVDAYTQDNIHCGTYFVTEPGVYEMPVYGDDERTPSVKDGAWPGDEITFYLNGYPAHTDDNTTWTENGDTKEVCLDLFTIEGKTIALNAGWNLISWNVDTPGDDIEDVFADVMSNVEVILGFEQGGMTYDPLLPEFSTLLDVDHYHGYWVKMIDPDVIVIDGSPVAATLPIELESGWNLVSYLPNLEYEPDYALAEVHDYLDVALGWRDGLPETYDPDLPEYATLEFMTTLYGYWLNMEAAMTLIYPGGGPSAAFGQSPAKLNAAAIENDVATSRLWADIYSHQLTLDGEVVPKGAEVLAVTVGGSVIGAGTVEDGGKFGFVPVYGDDPATDDVEGLTDGQTFSLVIDGAEVGERFIWSENSRLEIGSLTSKTTVSGLLPDEFSLAQNYPNPFNPSTTILFSIPTAGHVTLEIYNILGERVATPFDDMAPAGVSEVIWDGRNSSGTSVASGIYFYRMKAGDFEKTRKMVLMK